MNRRTVAVVLAVLSASGLIFSSIVDFSLGWPWVLPTAASLLVGAILTFRLPTNRVGWLLLWFGVGGGVTGFASAAALLMSNQIAAGWVDAVGYAINTAAVAYCLGAVLLRFPDGKLLGSRWRVAEWALIICAGVGSVAALLNGGWGGDPDQATVPSPLRVVTEPVGDILSLVFGTTVILAWGACAVSAVLRYRRSLGEERLQMRWLVFAGVLVGLLALSEIVVALIVGDFSITASGPLAVLVALSFASLPVAIAIAVLKYRLYDIDVVISRTVVLAILAGFITLVYSLVVVGIGNYLIGDDSEGLFFPILATAIVALAFEPVRNMAQGWANRLVYGQRATPYEVLSDLTGRLSHGEEGEGLLGRMARRLADGTGADRATIWLGSEGHMAIGSSWPIDPESGHEIDLESDEVFRVTHDGVLVGAFEVVKQRGSVLSSAERSLVDDLAGSAGAVLGYQRLNDSLSEKAAELTRSRARLVDAQDRERRRLERDLHDGAQQLIVALKVKIGLAKAMAAKHDAADLEGLLDGLSDEAQAALDEVRSLAKGIYPPVLESDGLGSALSALASGSPEEVVLHCDGLRRYERDIEATIYFEVSEAVTNAVKHASGPIHVALVGTDDSLAFSVEDSGPGFDVATANGGSGLQNLRDRIDAVGGSLEIVSSDAGTTVSGEVPLVPA